MLSNGNGKNQATMCNALSFNFSPEPVATGYGAKVSLFEAMTSCLRGPKA